MQQIIKKYPGMKKHPHIFNINDPELKIKSRSDGVNIYQYRCGGCGKIITYYDGEKKSIYFPHWDFEKLPSKKEQNLDKFNKYIKKQREQEQEQQQQHKREEERNRTGSAVQLSDDYQPLPPSAYETPKYDDDDFDDDIYIYGDKYTLYNPNDN